MKSTIQQLQNRGYVPMQLFDHYEILNNREMIWMLNSPVAEERTISAQMLGERQEAEAITGLCEALRAEKKLYTKIAICEALVKLGYPAVDYLLPLLGTIGNNQHKVLPANLFEKSSFPLPRDIVARTIAKIGEEALPGLEQLLISGNLVQVLEAIDAVGHIAYYSKNHSSYFALNLCLNRFSNNVMVQWKVIRAFQAFPQTKMYLETIHENIAHARICDEAKRSLSKFSN